MMALLIYLPQQDQVNFYILHSVKLNGKYHQHSFAVVWWFKADGEKEHFGKPAQVWKRYDYVPCGPAHLYTCTRMRQKFACCSVKLNKAEKVVVNLIPRSFHYF